MLKFIQRGLWWALFLCLAPALALAQGTDCPDLVAKALAAADQACQATGRNQACYGNVDMTAEAQPGVENFSFTQMGDIVNVSDLRTIRLSPMIVEESKWGVALLRLQANLPDTLPGQNVTFLLFGDVEITNAVDPGAETEYNPMQAFYLKTSTGDAQCAEAPESGMLVQTPEGAGQVAFNVNGVDVDMGSTVFFQSAEEAGMTVSTLEGAAYITYEEETQVIVPGTWARIPVQQRFVEMRSATGGLLEVPVLAPGGAPEPPKSYQKGFTMMNALPLNMLERPIEMAAPLSEDEVQHIRELAESGAPLCGDTPLPSCDKFPQFNRDNRKCVMPPGPNDPPLPDTETRPLCNEATLRQVVTGGDGRNCVMRPGPNDPPLPDTETRPFCEQPGQGGRPPGPGSGTPPPVGGTPPPGGQPPPGGTPPPPGG